MDCYVNSIFDYDSYSITIKTHLLHIAAGGVDILFQNILKATKSNKAEKH
jgi:hypothetical protein